MVRPNMSEVVRVLEIADRVWAETLKTKRINNSQLTGVFLPPMVDVTVPTMKNGVVGGCPP